MFSFHATKVFNTIEGGAVCFKNDALVQVLNDMKNFGIHGPALLAKLMILMMMLLQLLEKI